ncbi:MAG: alpha/beta hydrolase [Bacteroidales bacterium]|nr:alpha/beta hydrolase [Bacteroidales bacterium]
MRGIVIFIHGFAEGPKVFGELPALVSSQGWDTQLLILPGHGGTCREFSKTDGSHWLACVEEAISRAAVEYDSIVLVGHSMGGLFSILCANKYTKVKALVLISTPLAVRVTLRAVRTNLTVGLKKTIPQDRYAYAASQALSVAPGKPWDYIGWLPRLRDLFSYIKQSRRVLPQIHIPIICFHGAKDELIGSKSLRLFKSLAPNAELHILHESSHFTYPATDFNEIETAIKKTLKELKV